MLISSFDNSNQQHVLSDLGKKIISCRNVILKNWEIKVREKLPQAKEIAVPVLINTLPVFIEKLAEAVSMNHQKPTEHFYNMIAKEHGGERARLTNYSHEHLIGEYQILRWVLIEVLTQDGAVISEKEMLVIHAAIDEAIQEAASTFALVQSEFRNQYIATISHDLKTPLTSVAMSADFLLRKTDDPQLLRHAAKIKQNSSRMTRMIDDLLDVSSWKTSGRLQLNLEPCDAKSIIDEVIDELDSSQTERIKLICQNVHGHWDKNYLRRALENLVNNAFKYSNPEGPITIKLESSFEKLMFRIHNDGPPIPVEERESIFQAFRRSSAAKKGSKKGWGLGLPLVRAVAESHGGSVVLESSYEKGTTFIIDIPLDARPFSDAPITPL